MKHHQHGVEPVTTPPAPGKDVRRDGGLALLRKFIHEGPPTTTADWTMHSLLLSLGSAIAIVGLAVLIRVTIFASLQTRLIYVTFFPAVMAASVIGGLPAGVLAALLSTIVTSFWLAPIAHTMEYLGLAAFVISCTLIIGVTEAMHRSRARAVKAESRATISDAIRESQAHLSAVINNAVDGIVVIDEAGIIRSVNSAVSRIFGYDPSELISHNVNVLMAEPYRSEHDSYIRAYLETGNAKIIGIGREVEGRRRDSIVFPIHLTISETQIHGKRAFIGFIRDISEQRNAQEQQDRLTEQLYHSERQARQQQALFKGVFDSAPDAIVVTDLSRHIRMVNPTFQHLFGFSAGDLDGAEDLRLYASRDDWRRLGSLMSMQGERGLITRENVSFRKKAGATFPGEIFAGYYRDASGTPLGYIGIIRDISEELTREEARRQSQKLEALGQLTGGIAHDFNNLLTTIIGNHEYLMERLIEPDEKNALRRANNAAEMAARLTSRLLTFARRRQLEPVTLNLNEIVSTISDMLRRTIGESISLELALAPDVPFVCADISELENVIINLALNSRDAMPNGGRLTIETRNLNVTKEELRPGIAPGHYVSFAVIDTGVGMTAEVAAKAFEPFFSTKGTGRGTGLGLSTVYGFAKQSGGAVTLVSTPGKGTTVQVLLPAARQLPLVRSDQNDVPLAIDAETVLVVEDDPDVRETTLRRVEGLGYVAIEAHNSASAIEMLETDRPVDLIFSDVVMPGGMSGYELAAWVKENRPDVKILLTSGYVNLGQVDPLARQEFPLLEKPYTREDLARMFRAVLIGRRSSNYLGGNPSR